MTIEDPGDDQDARAERLAAHKRYNMKALGRLVDSNRLTGVSRPTSGSGSRERPPVEDEPAVVEHDAAPLADDDVFPADPVGVGHGETEAVESVEDETDRLFAVADRMNIPIRLSGSGSGRGLLDGGMRGLARDLSDGGVDRSEMGDTVTRTGLGVRLDDPTLIPPEPSPPSAHRLARRMLDGEIGPGGRISDPRDVPGIVLDLAKDVPASVAVSVVRIDEEVEVVGDSVDPTIDPAIFTSVFSGVFRSVRPAARALEDGPLGTIRDVVIEGERMDLILRPLGDRYYLMVLEDRTDPQANLVATRMRMESIAPGLTAILAQQDGEV